MARKVYDLAVKSGTYPAVVNGKPKDKPRYRNVGSMLENDNGGRFLLIDRYVNFGAFPTRNPTDDQVLVSMFEPKDSGVNQLPDGSYEGFPPEQYAYQQMPEQSHVPEQYQQQAQQYQQQAQQYHQQQPQHYQQQTQQPMQSHQHAPQPAPQQPRQ